MKTGFVRRAMAFFLAVVLCTGSLTLLIGADGTATAATGEGMRFEAEDRFETATTLAAEPLTFEAEFALLDTTGGWKGTIFGNYVATKGDYGMNFDLGWNRNYGVFPRIMYGANQRITFESIDLRTVAAPGESIHLAITIVRHPETEVADDVATCYINGVKKAEKTGLSIGDLKTDRVFYLGGDCQTDADTGAFAYPFLGILKNVRLYSDVRTEAEIAADAQGFSAEDKSLIVAYDLTSKTPLADLSGKGNDLFNQRSYSDVFSKEIVYAYYLDFERPIHTFVASLDLPSFSSKENVIFGDYVNDEIEYVNFSINAAGAPKLSFSTAAGETVHATFDTVDVRGKMTEVALVHSDTDVKCYIDGELRQTITGDFAYHADAFSEADILDSGRVDPNGQYFMLGGECNTENEGFFSGELPYVALYAEPLTEGELNAVRTLGAAAELDSTVAYYDIANAKPGRIDDQSGNGEHLSRLRYNSSLMTPDNLYSRTEPLGDYAYSFAVVGDTQRQIMKDEPAGSTKWTARYYDWLVDNKDEKKIKYVLGMGDITQNDIDSEWVLAKSQIVKLDAAGIPYSLIMGNHDSVPQLDKYFADPADDFYTSRVTGYFEDGSLGNYYMNFEVGSTKYMVMNFVFGPSNEALEWASEIVEAHPDRRVIVTTHAYMNWDGTTLDAGDYAPPRGENVNNGEQIWEKFASQHENIILVLSGHISSSEVVARQDIGVHGNTVTQMLVDPQSLHVRSAMICMLYFNEDGSKVDVEWISAGFTIDERAKNPESEDLLYRALSPKELVLIPEEYDGDHDGDYTSFEESFDGKTIDDVTLSEKRASGSKVSAATKDAEEHGDVLHISAAPKAPAEYYLWTSRSAKWPITGTVTNGLLTGTCSKGEIVNAPIPTSDSDASKTYTIDGTTYKIVTGGYADVVAGVGNFMNTTKVKLPAFEADDGELLNLSFDFYVSPSFKHSEGLRCYLTSPDASGTARRVVLFRMRETADNVATLEQGSGMTVVAGASTTVLTGDTWYRMQIIVDRATTLIYVFLDGEFIFAASDATLLGMVGTSAIPMTFHADSLQFENPRVSGYGDHFGFIEMDRLTVTTETMPIKNQNLVESFDRYAGKEPTSVFASIGVSGSTVTDAYGSFAWQIPLSGNAGKTPLLNTSSYVAFDGESVMLEADYFIVDGTVGNVSAVFTQYLAKHDGASETKGTDLVLYQIAATGKGYATLTLSDGTAHKIAVGRWNNIALRLDLAKGLYDLYIDGRRVSKELPLMSGDVRLSDIIVPADAISIGAVSGSNLSGSVLIDQLRIKESKYPTVGERPLGNYDFEDYKYSEGMTFGLNSNDVPPALLTVMKQGKNTVLRLPTTPVGGEDAYALLLSNGKSASFDFVYDPAEPEKGILNGKEITLTADADGVYWYTSGSSKYKPVTAAYAGLAAGDGNILKPISLSHGTYSYETNSTVLLEADYFIEVGSKGTVQVMFDKLRTNGEEKSLGIFDLDVETGVAVAKFGSNKTHKETFRIGEWNNVKILFNLKSGDFDVYINGVLSHTTKGKDTTFTNVEIGYSAASMWGIVKVGRELNKVTPNAGAILVDDVRVVADSAAKRAYAADAVMQVIEGASIRLSDINSTGIRFGARFNEAALEELKTFLGAESITIKSRGTLIAPEQYYLAANAFTHKALEALPVSTPYVDVAFGGAYFQGDVGVYLPEGDYMVGSIVNLRDYNRRFAAACYVELLVDGRTMLLYSDVVVRSACEVATAALADASVDWSAEQKAVLERFAGMTK